MEGYDSMKKKLIAIALVSMLGLTACGNSESSKNEKSEKTAAAADASDAPADGALF